MQLNKKDKILLIMTDLDETFTPIPADSLLRFADIIKKIEAKEGIKIKIAPISGRPAAYVHATMQHLNCTFTKMGLDNIIEVGVGEQGAVAVWRNDNLTEKYIGKNPLAALQKAELKVYFDNSNYSKIFIQQPSNRFTSAFGLRKKFVANLKNEILKDIEPQIIKDVICNSKNNMESQKKIDLIVKNKLLSLINKYKLEFMQDIKNHFGQKISVCYSGVIEATPRGISKDRAIVFIKNQYEKHYDITGFIYCGDSENDKSAIKYISNLANMTEKNCTVLLPSNANENLESKVIEQWKSGFNTIHLKKVIEKQGFSVNEINSELNLEKKEKMIKINQENHSFNGIINLIKKKFEDGTLISKNTNFSRPHKTMDGDCPRKCVN